MSNFILNSTINVNNFIVNIYNIENENINSTEIAVALSDLSALDYPNKIVEKLQDINGVSKIEIFDENNKLLLNSEKFLT